MNLVDVLCHQSERVRAAMWHWLRRHDHRDRHDHLCLLPGHLVPLLLHRPIIIIIIVIEIWLCDETKWWAKSVNKCKNQNILAQSWHSTWNQTHRPTLALTKPTHTYISVKNTLLYVLLLHTSLSLLARVCRCSPRQSLRTGTAPSRRSDPLGTQWNLFRSKTLRFATKSCVAIARETTHLRSIVDDG